MANNVIQRLLGDMAVKDLSPKTTNVGQRLVKNLRICGSGIYTYAMSEAPLLQLTPVPKKFEHLDYINVYRPPEVLVTNKDKFARVPIITGHHVLVNRDNAKQLSVGMVGDTVTAEIDPDDGETYLYTTGTIVAGDGVDAYEKYGQLSVGYVPTMEWEEGVHNGVPYQAVLKGFEDVNHLLICKVARGGPQCMVMDSLDTKTPLQRFINQQHGGTYMGVFNKIFKSTQPQLAGDAATVSALLQSIALGADPKKTVDKIRHIAGDCGSEFNGFLDELAACGDEDPADIEKAVNIADTAWRKMQGDANTCGDKDDTKVVEVKKDGDDKNVEVKKDGKETKDIEVKKDGDKKDVTVTEKTNGDEINIDYDLLADKLAARMQKTEKTAGDEQINEEESAESLSRLSIAMAGDSDQKADVSSDTICKSIWG